MMKNLCNSDGIKYIHALQPNQYVEGSRVFTPEEKARAFKADHPYRPSVEEGYSKLLDASRGLVNRGVDFYDMTMVYRDLPEPIYQDDCSHPNPRGYEIIAELLAPQIAARLRHENQLP